MRRHHEVGRQVLRGEIVGDRLRHGVEIRHARDGAEFLLHDWRRTARPAPACGRRDARGDQVPRMRRQPRRAASPPDPPAAAPRRRPRRIAARIAVLAHRMPPARAARGRSGRRTCRPPAPAGRARRSSRRRTAACGSGRACGPAGPASSAAARVASRYSAGRRANERPQRQVGAHRRRRQVALELALAPVAHQLGQRDLHRADALALAAEGGGVGQVARLCRRRSAPASARCPSGRDRPSHRRGRRPRHTPGSGSCRRRSGCSAASPGTRCRASPSGRCPPARRGIRPARPDRRAAARRWRTWCRRRNPGRSRSAPARAAGWCSPRSSARIFSMLASTMCTRGRVCVRSPLPSLVTMTLLPVSAIRKLAPVMPTSAARNFARSRVRASVRMSRRSWNTRSGGRSVCDLRKLASQSSLLRWNAGAMMWLGSSWRSWMMYSPRSVSTGVMPWRSRWSLMPSSSLIIDLPLVTVRASGGLADRQHRGARFVGGGAPVHLAAGGEHLAPPIPPGRSRDCASVWFLMSRAMSRSCSNSGSAATAAARRAMKLGPLRASAFCSPASASARWAFSLKAGEVATCTLRYAPLLGATPFCFNQASSRFQPSFASSSR